jgi:dGTPase
VDELVSGLIEGTVARATVAGAQTVDDVQAFPERLAAFAPEAAETSRALKRFLYTRVYVSPVLLEGRNRSTEMIGGLFRYFVDDPGCLPEPYRRLAAEGTAHRVVCDYIAGMTDGFLRRTYRQLIGPLPGLPE